MTKIKPEIIFLDSMMDIEDIEELVNIYSEMNISNETICLCWSAPVIEILKNKYNLKIKFEYALDYVANEDLEEIDSRILEWLNKWYKSKDLDKYKEFIFYKDFPLSKFIENELYNLFQYTMKNIIAIDKFIAKENKNNHALVVFKTDIYSDLCGFILKEKGIDYGLYEFSHSKNYIFNKPVFYNWGLLPSFKAAVISTVYSFIETFSNILRLIRSDHQRKKVIIIDHHILTPLIDRLLKQGYDIFFPNNIRRFLSKEAIKKRIYYINTFASIKLDLTNYIKIRVLTVRSTSLSKKIYHNMRQLEGNKDFLNFKNIDLSLFVAPIFINMLRTFPVFFRVCQKIEQQLKKNKYDLFISQSLYGETNVYLHFGRKYNIKSVGFIHGIVMRKKFYDNYVNRSDYLLVWGTKMKDEYINRFANKDQIVIVGNIRFDSIKQNEKLKKKYLGLYDKEKVILFDYYDTMNFCFNIFYHTDYYDRVLFDFLKIIPKLNNVTLIIKVHPAGNPKRCRHLLRYFAIKNRVIILHKEDVMSLLPICTAVVSPGATTLCVDTIVNNVPFIAANFSRFPYIPYQGYRAFIEVFNEVELEDALRKIISDVSFAEKYKQDAEEFIRDFAYKIDGNSTERAVSAIENILKNENTER